MTNIMNSTYPNVALEAIKGKGGVAGAWERLIAERLLRDHQAGNKAAIAIVSAMGGLSIEKRMRAAAYIISSKIEDAPEPLPLIGNDEIDLGKSFQKLKESMKEAVNGVKPTKPESYAYAVGKLETAIKIHLIKCTGENMEDIQKYMSEPDPNDLPDHLFTQSILKEIKK